VTPSGMERLEDRALVAAFLERADEGAFRRLYAAHTPRLYLSLLRLSGGREAEAEELLQETWIRAAGSLSSFRWESALRTWLYGIAINAWREASRARRGAGLSLDSVAEKLPAALPAPGAGAEHLDLERAVRQLPEGYREVLVLHDIEGYTHEEIAGLLGILPGTSKSQLSRARACLRRWLSPPSARREKERIQ
jgi:RNA polymerase sigma-70 factor, ECF subfamily